MHKRFVALLAMFALGLLTIGGGVASAGQSNRTYRGSWTGVVNVCAGANIDEVQIHSSGTWSLVMKRDGSGTFRFHYMDDQRMDGVHTTDIAGDLPVTTLFTRPLVVTGQFVEGDFTMTTTIADDRVVMAATTTFPCDDEPAPHYLTPVFLGTVR